MRPGPLNLITDVRGLKVGNAHDARLRSGTTVLSADAPFVAAVNVMGGAPGTRDTDLLMPGRLVEKVDALVLSGGSVFGLDAAGGVMDELRDRGRGFAIGDIRVPIVPGAIVFDLLNGGDKGWPRNPYYDLGRSALRAADERFDIGSAGAGFGATTYGLKGGLGSASAVLDRGGFTVGALVAVNALGSAVAGAGPEFWAAPWEQDGEFGGRGLPRDAQPTFEPPASKDPGEATTIAIVATDASLTQAQAERMAVAAHDGMARALVPSHTLLDGDLVFAAATGDRPLTDPVSDQFALGHAAAICLARAIARAVYSASALPGDDPPAWRARFGA